MQSQRQGDVFQNLHKKEARERKRGDAGRIESGAVYADSNKESQVKNETGHHE